MLSGPYMMTRYTIVAPSVTNAGEPSGYPDDIRGLLGRTIAGWTEHETTGHWHGAREPGVTFDILLDERQWNYTETFLQWLAFQARQLMPDQEAIQLTREPVETLVYEA